MPTYPIPGVVMAEESTSNNDELMSEFAEFLEAKRAKEKETAESEDFEVEIWDEKGRGVRTRRSHAKPFLNSLGIDVDPPAKGGTDDVGDQTKTKKTSPRKAAPVQPQSVRKYFTGK
jgi:hypothetical protein